MQTALEDASYADLVERCGRGAERAGDRAAETEVCRRFAPRIRLYGLKHLRDEDRAGDLVQLVLVAVIEAVRVGRIAEPHHLDRFVLGTCRNLTARVRAADRRTESLEPSVLETLGAALPATESLDFAALSNCLHRLEQRAQSIIHLSFHRDKTADEIGSVLGMTAGNVRVVRHRAMAQLRDCLEAA